eukprot:3846183-Pyramimonas_sp.AAC.1
MSILQRGRCKHRHGDRRPRAHHGGGSSRALGAPEATGGARSPGDIRRADQRGAAGDAGGQQRAQGKERAQPQRPGGRGGGHDLQSQDDQERAGPGAGRPTAHPSSSPRYKPSLTLSHSRTLPPPAGHEEAQLRAYLQSPRLTHIPLNHEGVEFPIKANFPLQQTAH